MEKRAAYEFMAATRQRVLAFLQSLADPAQPGRHRLALTGVTEAGAAGALGFSCFAAKTYLMLNAWDDLPKSQRDAWIEFLKSYQQDASPHGFVDPAILQSARANRSWKAKLGAIAGFSRIAAQERAYLLAETKQAVATLADLGTQPRWPFEDIPGTATALDASLQGQDWSQPWAAGGQSSAIVTLLSIQGKMPKGSALHATAAAFFDHLADPNSGAYWKGAAAPDWDNLINGAMKVLTALDWMEEPVRYPEALIDTCLARPPKSEGCHLVDVIYVLWMAGRQTSHRRGEVEAYALNTLDLIREHARPDGGFSYGRDVSQTLYYRARVGTGAVAADLHGTVLLCWAIAMVRQLCGMEDGSWRTMKP